VLRRQISHTSSRSQPTVHARADQRIPPRRKEPIAHRPSSLATMSKPSRWERRDATPQAAHSGEPSGRERVQNNHYVNEQPRLPYRNPIPVSNPNSLTTPPHCLRMVGRPSRLPSLVRVSGGASRVGRSRRRHWPPRRDHVVSQVANAAPFRCGNVPACGARRRFHLPKL
jgi:hypothetical protein